MRTWYAYGASAATALVVGGVAMFYRANPGIGPDVPTMVELAEGVNESYALASSSAFTRSGSNAWSFSIVTNIYSLPRHSQMQLLMDATTNVIPNFIQSYTASNYTAWTISNAFIAAGVGPADGRPLWTVAVTNGVPVYSNKLGQFFCTNTFWEVYRLNAMMTTTVRGCTLQFKTNEIRSGGPYDLEPPVWGFAITNLTPPGDPNGDSVVQGWTEWDLENAGDWEYDNDTAQPFAYESWASHPLRWSAFEQYSVTGVVDEAHSTNTVWTPGGIPGYLSRRLARRTRSIYTVPFQPYDAGTVANIRFQYPVEGTWRSWATNVIDITTNITGYVTSATYRITFPGPTQTGTYQSVTCNVSLACADWFPSDILNFYAPMVLDFYQDDRIGGTGWETWRWVIGEYGLFEYGGDVWQTDHPTAIINWTRTRCNPE
jgi:hypothetical protein